MTDHEQIRRDAEAYMRGKATVPKYELCARILALLAELEQAERELDDWKAACEESQASEFDLRAQLAAVPALVEALRHVEDAEIGQLSAVARDALITYEQAQR